MFKKHPRQIGAGTLSALNELLPSEGYRIINDTSQLPAEIANYCGTNFLCSLIMGTSCTQDSHLPFAANGNIWVVKTFRMCNHDGTAHYNADLRMFYQGFNEQSWMASSRENPDHYTLALTGTTLQDVRIATCLPNNDIGELDKMGMQAHILNASSIWPDFSMPLWDDRE